jgi:hypothetical protein
MDKTRSLLGEGSAEVSNTSYPNRQFAASLKESQESLLTSSIESLIPESRESSLQSNPVCSPDRYPSEKVYIRQGSWISDQQQEQRVLPHKLSKVKNPMKDISHHGAWEIIPLSKIKHQGITAMHPSCTADMRKPASVQAMLGDIYFGNCGDFWSK